MNIADWFEQNDVCWVQVYCTRLLVLFIKVDFYINNIDVLWRPAGANLTNSLSLLIFSYEWSEWSKDSLQGYSKILILRPFKRNTKFFLHLDVYLLHFSVKNKMLLNFGWNESSLTNLKINSVLPQTEGPTTKRLSCLDIILFKVSDWV